MDAGTVEPEECSSCGYAGRPLETFRAAPHHQREGDTAPRRLCEVCSSTFISNMVEHSHHHDHSVVMLAQALGWATNRILDAIEKGPVVGGRSDGA